MSSQESEHLTQNTILPSNTKTQASTDTTLSNNFDAMKYLASNNDLIDAFGANTTEATTHYVTTGHNEGRTINFDAMKYLASNNDLIDAFGANTTEATTHYVTTGHNEGRTINFDAASYLANNADLQAAFGTNQALATQHYVEHGYAEHRIVSPVINSSAIDTSVELLGVTAAITTQHSLL